MNALAQSTEQHPDAAPAAATEAPRYVLSPAVDVVEKEGAYS